MGKSHNSVETAIIGMLRQEVGRDVAATGSLGMDSLRMAELATELEVRFGFRIDEELLDVETVKELVEYVRSRAEKS